MIRITRFPPEPSGYLHIGHAKAMMADFDSVPDARCILRLDDTNPDTETAEFAESIVRDCEWLGYKPWKVTYTSDYFDDLWRFAERLISQGHAYICHSTAEDRSITRREGRVSSWRDRPMEESIRLFRDMNVKVREGTTLRLRTEDRQDPVAYRQKTASHFRTGTKWLAYPSYDMSHCIVDSLEGVTDSFCTREFYDKRVSYFWLLDVLGLRKPHVYEFARLNLSEGITSKRRIKALIDEKIVDAWDDPSLLTLSGLRRRGIPARSIKSFCKGLGLTTAESSVPVHNLFHHVRETLNESCPRVMAVCDRLQVTIVNLDNDRVIQALEFPQNKSCSDTYRVFLSSQVFIDRSDFRTSANAKFYGLTPSRTVLLKYVGVVSYLSHRADESGRVFNVDVKLVDDYDGKVPKGVLTWIGNHDVVSKKVKCPSEAGDASTSSDETVYGQKDRLEFLSTSGLPFQIERRGYFVADKRTDTLIRICCLKSDKGRAFG